MATIKTLADLQSDPRNARRHTPRNVGMIETALKEVGAARSIVIDENGTVLAGNATIEAAGAAGIEKVQVVDADGETIIAVRRSGLTKDQKTKLALYDNRANDLSDFDPDVLAELSKEVDLSKFWNAEELQYLLADLPELSEDEQGAAQQHATLASRFLIPPFSVLDARQGYWQDRKRAWLSLGIQSELGRGGHLEGVPDRQPN